MGGVAQEKPREETLGEFLASRARSASEIRLVGDAAFSVLAAVAVGVWRGPLWDVRIAIALCFLAFGIWGVADRDIGRREGATNRRDGLVVIDGQNCRLGDHASECTLRCGTLTPCCGPSSSS